MYFIRILAFLKNATIINANTRRSAYVYRYSASLTEIYIKRSIGLLIRWSSVQIAHAPPYTIRVSKKGSPFLRKGEYKNDSKKRQSR